jgi:hypothetical protein
MACAPRRGSKNAIFPTVGYRRDYLCALAQRVEVDAEELRIMGSKSELLCTLVTASSAKTAGFGVPSSVPKWRTRHGLFEGRRGAPGHGVALDLVHLVVGLKGTYTSELHLKSLPIPATR